MCAGSGCSFGGDFECVGFGERFGVSINLELWAENMEFFYNRDILSGGVGVLLPDQQKTGYTACGNRKISYSPVFFGLHGNNRITDYCQPENKPFTRASAFGGVYQKYRKFCNFRYTRK